MNAKPQKPNQTEIIEMVIQFSVKKRLLYMERGAPQSCSFSKSMWLVARYGFRAHFCNHFGFKQRRPQFSPVVDHWLVLTMPLFIC